MEKKGGEERRGKERRGEERENITKCVLAYSPLNLLKYVPLGVSPTGFDNYEYVSRWNAKRFGRRSDEMT